VFSYRDLSDKKVLSLNKWLWPAQHPLLLCVGSVVKISATLAFEKCNKINQKLRLMKLV